MTPASLAFSDIFANQTLCHIRHTPTGKNPNPRPLDLPPTFTRADNTERTLSANANTRATHPAQSTWVFNTQPAHSPHNLPIRLSSTIGPGLRRYTPLAARTTTNHHSHSHRTRRMRPGSINDRGRRRQPSLSTHPINFDSALTSNSCRPPVDYHIYCKNFFIDSQF